MDANEIRKLQPELLRYSTQLDDCLLRTESREYIAI